MDLLAKLNADLAAKKWWHAFQDGTVLATHIAMALNEESHVKTALSGGKHVTIHFAGLAGDASAQKFVATTKTLEGQELTTIPPDVLTNLLQMLTQLLPILLSLFGA